MFFLRMSFLILNNVEVNFSEQKFFHRICTLIKTLSTPGQVKLVVKKKFTIIVFDS